MSFAKQGYDRGVRFRLSVDVWMEVESLAAAQDAMTRVSRAAHDALGPAAVEDTETGALGRYDLSPLDQAATEAFKADDLGPGISSATFSAPRPAEREER